MLKKIFYNNFWHKSFSKKKYINTSPIKKNTEYYPECSSKDLSKVINSACIGLSNFSDYDLIQRSQILKSISIQIRKKYKIIAKLESLDTGKKIKDAQNEILYASKIWNYASEEINTLKPVDKKFGNGIKAKIIFEPVGCVALITPWNYPFIVISERLPFILAAGNSVIIKPSEYASRSITYLVNILKEQNLPDGVINLLYGSGKKIGRKLVSNKKINMISFTGSTIVGKKIINLSSGGVKRLSLELGGKNSIIVMSDANIKKAVDITINSFCSNSGQACVATSKLVLDKKIKTAFIKELKKKLHSIKDFKKILGPITTSFQFKRIHKILKKNSMYNENVIFGDLTKKKNNYIFPIVYDNLPLNNIINQEEIFGPILSIITFENENEAINIANNTNYGLSAVICSKNINYALDISKKINSGRIWINQSILKNFPDLPIGGYKESGLNRECGTEGFKTYSEIKSIILKK